MLLTSRTSSTELVTNPTTDPMDDPTENGDKIVEDGDAFEEEEDMFDDENDQFRFVDVHCPGCQQKPATFVGMD